MRVRSKLEVVLELSGTTAETQVIGAVEELFDSEDIGLRPSEKSLIVAFLNKKYGDEE